MTIALPHIEPIVLGHEASKLHRHAAAAAGFQADKEDSEEEEEEDGKLAPAAAAGAGVAAASTARLKCQQTTATSPRGLDASHPKWRQRVIQVVHKIQVRPRWLYFAYFSYRAMCAGRFMAMFYAERSMEASEMGFLFAADALCGMVSSSFVTTRIDQELARGHKNARQRSLLMAFTISLFVFCSQVVVDWGWPVPTFIFFLVCRVLMSLAITPIISILDSHTLVCLVGNEDRFGEERTWGAISWAITNMILGVVMDHMGTEVMYWGAIVTGLFSCVCICASFENDDHEIIAQHPKGEPAVVSEFTVHNDNALVAGLKLTKAYLGKPQSASFIFAIFCLGAGVSLVENLLFLLLVDDLHSSYTVCGISVVVTVAFEIPLLQGSRWLLRNFSCRLLFSIALVCYIVRAVGYTFCPNGWCILGFEPLHGITFACYDLAAVRYVAAITPAEQLTTGQGIRNAVQSGIGFLFGTFFGGLVIQHFGETVLYRGAAALVTMGLVGFRVFGGMTELSRPSSAEEKVPDRAASVGKETDFFHDSFEEESMEGTAEDLKLADLRNGAVVHHRMHLPDAGV